MADAAIAKLKDLRAAQVDLARAGKDTKADVSQLDQALQALGSRTGGVRDVVEGTTQVMRGNEQAVFGLAKAVRSLKELFTGASSWLGIAGLIGAGLTAALALVRKFRQDAKDEQEKAAKDADDIAKKLQERLAKIGEMKMESLRKEIDSITQAYARAREEADRLYTSQVRITDAELGAQLEANRLAEAEGKLTPEQRARADADARGAAEERKLNLKQQQLQTRAAKAQETLATAQPKLAELRGQQKTAERQFSEALDAAVRAGTIRRPAAEMGDFEGTVSMYQQQIAESEKAFGDPMAAFNRTVTRGRLTDVSNLQRLYRARQFERGKATEIKTLENEQREAAAELASIETESIVLANERAAGRSGRRADVYGLDAKTAAEAAAVGGPAVETPEMAADKAGRFVLGSVLPQQRWRGRGYGGEPGLLTQRDAQAALREAASKLREPDSDDAAIIAELFAKWEKMGARIKYSQAQIRRALDLLDGKIELEDQRSKAERGYTL
jgi:hypothetical protein